MHLSQSHKQSKAYKKCKVPNKTLKTYQKRSNEQGALVQSLTRKKNWDGSREAVWARVPGRNKKVVRGRRTKRFVDREETKQGLPTGRRPFTNREETVRCHRGGHPSSTKGTLAVGAVSEEGTVLFCNLQLNERHRGRFLQSETHQGPGFGVFNFFVKLVFLTLESMRGWSSQIESAPKSSLPSSEPILPT